MSLPELALPHGIIVLAGFFGIVAASTFGLVALFAWRWTVKPVLAVLLIAAAFGAHFMGTYGTIIDATMMTNVLQTNPSEVRDLLSVRMLLGVLVLALLPLIGIGRAKLDQRGGWRQLRLNALGIAAALMVIAALIFALFADLSATMRNHKSERYLVNPVNSFYALGVLAHETLAKSKGPLQAIGLDARIAVRPSGQRPPLLLLVIGETARAANFSLNGYARPTNPELLNLGVVSFRDVTSCGTSTAASLPCMFSHLGRKDHGAREVDHENLLDLLYRAGLAVLWLDNQSGCKSLCDRVPNTRANVIAPGGVPLPSGLCQNGECLDGALLHGLNERIAALPAERRDKGVVLVMHQMGSHGPAYYQRSPPERKPFLPECTTNVLQQCDRQQLLNAYDNSIAYTDHVLAENIGWLKKQSGNYDPSLLYVSDHGESLGENNLYLHGMPYALAPRFQTHVPLIVWLPPGNEGQVNSTLACLNKKRDNALSHDNLFHTVLGLLGVTAKEYRPALDAFAPCAVR